MFTKSHTDYQVLFFNENDLSQKKCFSKSVYDLLNTAYKACGGIAAGRGFQSEKDMLENIPFWRLTFKQGKLISAMMFKVTDLGNKMVAYAPVKNADYNIKDSDINYMMNHSYTELSGALLITVLKNLGSNWSKYILNAGKIMFAKKIKYLKDFCEENEIPENSKVMCERLKKEWSEILDFSYLRIIGTDYKVKVLMGTISN